VLRGLEIRLQARLAGTRLRGLGAQPLRLVFGVCNGAGKALRLPCPVVRDCLPALAFAVGAGQFGLEAHPLAAGVLELATKANEATGSLRADVLETLAMARAANGDPAAAGALVEKALELPGPKRNAAFRERLQAQLQTYRSAAGQ